MKAKRQTQALCAESAPGLAPHLVALVRAESTGGECVIEREDQQDAA